MDENRAVVIGASISGLLAARVLADYFGEVVVIERDAHPPAAEPRKGAPQGRHLHVLLSRGRDLLEGFFPGFTQQLAEQGANVGDLSETVCWYAGGAYSRNFRSGLVSIQASRPLVEESIYRRLCEFPNITFLEHHDAAGLLTAPDGAELRVTGVKLVDRRGAEPVEKFIPARLVVDAGGRGSRVLGWLEELGYARPPEEQIKMALAYTTRVFRRAPEHAQGRNPIVILPSAANHRGGTAQAVEGERWIVTLAGMLGQAAPGDMPGFIEFARTLDAPDLYEVVRQAEPIGEASTYKYPASQRRYFEKLARFPDGLLVTGDALCSFNPIYGQGMTTAAAQADLLGACLREGLAGSRLRRAFFQRAGRLLESPWSIAAGSDLAFPGVEGKRAASLPLVQGYLNRLLAASSTDHDLNLAFQKVTNLIEPPASLFRPRIFWRVMTAKPPRE